jgi:hypothetical protein
MSGVQNLFSHAVIMDGAPVPPPTELSPYEWIDVPDDFGKVRGFGGAVTYVITAQDAGFQITCKTTDLTYSFLSVLRARKKAAAALGQDPRFTLTWRRGDTGETWTGTGCTFAAIPGGKSDEQPTVVTWGFNVETVTITPPDAAILPPEI